jgi:hypothetical protein
VVNLERDLYNLRLELARVTGRTEEEVSKLMLLQQGKNLNINNNNVAATDDDNDNEIVILTTTELYDGGGGGLEADEIRSQIRKKEISVALERRAVFRGWLKNVFLGQAILSFVLSYVMATNPDRLFGNYDWFHMYNM